MAQNQMRAGSSVFQDMLVVDADVHVSTGAPETGKKIAQRMDMPWKELLDPTERSIGRGTPTSGHFGEIPGKMKAIRQSVVDPVEDIDEPLREEFGVDHPILNANARLDMIPESRRIVPQMRATNDMFIEHFLDANEDYFGLGTIAMEEPDKAAEEIDRIGSEDRLVGILIHPGGQEKALGHPRYDPIYEAAEDNDLTVGYHTTFDGFLWDMPGILKSMDTNLEIHSLQHPWAMMWTVSSLITNGTPVKFPDLNFAILESGIGWVPYMMARLNREYGSWRSQAPLLEEMPEDYIRDRFYFTTQPLGEFNDRSHMADIIDILGPENIMFSSDHPHFDFDEPSSIHGFFSDLPPEDQEKVFHGNAIEAFGLPISS